MHLACPQWNEQNIPQNGQNIQSRVFRHHETPKFFMIQHVINAFHSQNAQSVKNISI